MTHNWPAANQALRRDQRGPSCRFRVWTAIAGTLGVIVMACARTAPAVAQTFTQRTLSFGGAVTNPQGLAVDSAGDLFATGFSSVTDSVVEMSAKPSGG